MTGAHGRLLLRLWGEHGNRRKGETRFDTFDVKHSPRHSCDCHIAQSPRRTMQTGENFGRRVGGTSRGRKLESAQTNHHHHVNVCARARVVTPTPGSSSSSSSLPGLYKSLHSPFREHGGSSTSQVSNSSADQAEKAVLTQAAGFQMIYIFDVFIGWLTDYNYIIFGQIICENTILWNSTTSVHYSFFADPSLCFLTAVSVSLVTMKAVALILALAVITGEDSCPFAFT